MGSHVEFIIRSNVNKGAWLSEVNGSIDVNKKKLLEV